MSFGISVRFQTLFPCQRQVAHVLLTRPPLTSGANPLCPFDLNVLCTPPAFIVSQDQTLCFFVLSQSLQTAITRSELIRFARFRLRFRLSLPKRFLCKVTCFGIGFEPPFTSLLRVRAPHLFFSWFVVQFSRYCSLPLLAPSS